MKQKKNLKFKIQYVPLSDDRISRHKDFDGLMAAYAVAPKPNVFRRWLNSRYFLFGSGLVAGLTFSGLMFLRNISDHVETVTTNKSTQQTIQQEQTTTAPKTHNNIATESQGNSAEYSVKAGSETEVPDNVADVSKPAISDADVANNNDNKTTSGQHVSNNSTTRPFANSGTKNQSLSSKASLAEKQGSKQIQSAADLNAVSETENETVVNAESTNVNADATKSGATDNQSTIISTTLVKPDSVNAATLNNVATEATSGQPPGRFETATTENQSQQTSNIPTHSDTIVSNSVATEIQPVDETSALIQQNDSLADSTINNETPADKAEETNELQPGKEDKTKKQLLSGLFTKKDPTKSNSGKNFFSFIPHNDNESEEDTTFINRYAQASFVTPIGSNGSEGSKYKHHFSLNVLQGNTGALEGVEFGGLANIEKGYMYGAQFGGLANIVGGSVKGVQFGGLANTSRSLKGAQFGGVANVNMRGGTGAQFGGVVNVSAGSDPFNGWQVAGAANYTYGNFNGVQLSGAANLNTTKLDGGQISGAFNVANEIDGFQLGVINFARKMKGFQFGVINLADTSEGLSIGLINASRNGQFSMDIWSSDYLQINGGLKVGNKTMYNIFAFGFSPFGQSAPRNDSLILYESSLPFGFGIGLGGHIPIKKAFVDIDGMCWMVHDRYFNWEGENLLNQLRVLGGYRVHKYFGIYAGPVANVSVQNHIYEPFRKNAIYEYVGKNTTVKGWVGFAAGIQLF